MMKKIVFTFILFFALSTGLAAQSAEILNLQESFVKISEQVKPAVVNIATVYFEKQNVPQYEFFFGSPFEDFFEKPVLRKYEGMGSGVIIDSDGYILTNEHVIRGAKEIKVTTADDKTYIGKIIGRDVRTDLAVIKIKADKNMPAAKLGDSDKIKVGEWAIAIGSPFGLEETVTTGIISAVRQSLNIEGHEYRNLFQTDAAINRGNSGGPLCNIKGEVIGINTAIYAPTGVFSGIGFAIPVNNAKAILDDLIHKGKVDRGWIGVEIRPIDNAIANQYNLPDKSGVMINDVMENSPAAASGLQRGDIIREINNKKIENSPMLQDIISQAGPKKKINMKIIRGKKEINMDIVIAEMPSEDVFSDEKQETVSYQWQGMKVSNLTNAAAMRFDIPNDEKGCIVLSIEADSPAESMGILPGDLIRGINQAPTPSIKEFQAVTKKASFDKGVVFDINRQGRLFYISYYLEK